MISFDDAMKLLEKEKVKNNIVRHSVLVNSVARYISEKLKECGVSVDLDLVDISSILHDVGRGRSHVGHDEIGTEIMMGMGEEDIAQIIKVHGIKSFKELSTIE